MSKELIERLHDKFGCEWKPVPSLDGKYLVSDTGVIYSVPRRYTKGGVLKTHCAFGYERVCLSSETQLVSKNPLVHQLVMLAFVGEPNGMEVRHLDGDKMNNRLSNLAYGTKIDNERDKVRHGTRLCGERTPSAKLTWNQVCRIRENHGVISQKALAEEFGVNRTTVQRIQSGQHWKTKD